MAWVVFGIAILIVLGLLYWLGRTPSPARTSPEEAASHPVPSEEPADARALRDPRFWRWYLGMDGGETDPDPGAWARSARFEVSLTEVWSVVVDADPTTNAIELYLRDDETDEKLSLGWVDDVRAHPFGLRWEEVDAIAAAAAASEVGEHGARALLSPFAGTDLSDPEVLARRRRLAAESLVALGIEPAQAAEMGDEAARTVPGETDYAWSVDEELGWCFAGEYPCYSLRNRAHLGDGCGAFPFEPMRELRHELGIR